MRDSRRCRVMWARMNRSEQEPIILHVRYTGEEYLGLIKDINRRSFIRTIPFSGGSHVCWAL